MSVIPHFPSTLGRPLAAVAILAALSFGILAYAPRYLPHAPASLDTAVVLLLVPAACVLLAMLGLAVRLVSRGAVPEEMRRPAMHASPLGSDN